MNIDDLVNSVPEPKLGEELAHWVNDWKKNSTDIHHLYDVIAKWHGNVWFQDQNIQDTFWTNLKAFKVNAIDGVDGMTLNERLYCFGLFGEWDASDNAGKQRIRAKLHASA